MATAEKSSDSSESSRRVIWKGAISFGLVHVPVALHTAAGNSEVDFDWLDKRTMDPVGYKRINKKTGDEITSENIVRGVEVEDGKYVVLSNEEIKAALPKATQTIEIESFVVADELPPYYMEKPYYVSPINKGEKVYALLREALIETKRVGIAKVIISSKQHLAVLMPKDEVLVLNLMRWAEEVRGWNDLKLPESGTKAVGIKPAEMAMATQLINEMTTKWNPKDYVDTFRDEIDAIIAQKVKSGKVESVEKIDPEAPETSSAEIIDLTELLKKSLRGKAENEEKRSAKSTAKVEEDAPPKKARKAK